MHTSGKVLAWAAIPILAVAAIYLSARTLATRNAWMALALKNEATFNANQETIAKKTAELEQKRTELARAMLGWDRYWPEIGARFDRDGNLALNIGTTYGVQNDAVLFVFGINPDGTSKYLGDFKVIRTTPKDAQAQPNWRVRPGDLGTSPTPVVVRVRSLIPNQFQARLASLDQQLLAQEERIAAEKDQLARQKQLGELSAAQIALRLGQIEGDDTLKGQPLPDEITKGYLAAIRDADEGRNAALLEADRLLRELNKTRRDFEETLRANRRLTETLPQSAPGERTVGAVGR